MVVKDPLDRLTAQQVVEALIELHDSAPPTITASATVARGEREHVASDEDAARRTERKAHREKRSVSGRSERTARTTKTTKTERSRRSERDRHRDRSGHHDRDRDRERERDSRRRAEKERERAQEREREREEIQREKEEMHRANADRKRKSAEKVGNWQTERLDRSSRAEASSTTAVEIPEEPEPGPDLARTSSRRSRKEERADPMDRPEKSKRGEELKVDTGAPLEKPKKPKSERAEAEAEAEDTEPRPEKSEKGDKAKRKGKDRDDKIGEVVEVKSEPRQSLDSEKPPKVELANGDIEAEVRPSDKGDSKQKAKSKSRKSKP
jgi:hypothetical protein